MPFKVAASAFHAKEPVSRKATLAAAKSIFRGIVFSLVYCRAVQLHSYAKTHSRRS